MDYKIPDDILTKIPQYFWPAFAGELVSTFGLSIFEKSEEGLYVLFNISSTCGWSAALRTTCDKLNMKWLFDYYDKLEWWQSDMFDGEFEDLLIKNYVEVEDKPEYAYYNMQFLEQNVYSLSQVPPSCQGCSNHPSNGGCGICHCTLGLSEIW